jgi:oligosaccharide reducing-end xylanase
MRALAVVLSCVTVTVAAACSGSGNPAASNTGGDAGTGGAGAVTASGGSSTGGVDSSSGAELEASSTSGGVQAAGGSSATGSSTGSGGTVSSGGAPASTGGTGTGASMSDASGGLGASGASPGDGGSTTTGGATSTSGGSAADATGGAADPASSGGAVSTGGSSGAAGGARAACVAPVAYRNLFIDILGKSPEEVEERVENIVQQLFHGTGEQPIYYELGSDQAYITDINNNDVRSEGVSYGMLIAVTMDMKTEFDKLWNFAAKRMRQSSGLFAWQLDTSGSVLSTNDAPDGDEYFAMALILASRRWGDSTGTDYAGEAKKVLTAMVDQGGFNRDPAVVTFGPPYNTFTDPSYVLPLFYSEWACFDTDHAEFWQSATTYARSFFARVTDPSTGLAPDHASFDGSPQGDYGADAIRVPMNIMMDYNLNHVDPWQDTYAATMSAFWTEQGLANYGEAYALSGTSKGNGHGAGAAGVNAMVAFALDAASATPFLEAVWNAETPTGKLRYYEGCLYMLSMLHLSGKFSLLYD